MTTDLDMAAQENATPLVAVLAKTGLSLEGDALVKREGNGVVGRHSLTTIVRVELVKRTDGFGIVFTAATLAGAVAVKFLVPNPNWSWTGFILLALGSLVLMLGIRSTVLSVVTKHGDVGYSLSDPQDQAEAFVVTIRERIARGADDRL